ncbi:low temperature requirement protein A [Glycomyces dulcitolivorans]|uniref:low temperature requirement protein A n=1 Tax=Glycomyces dulcitolivorans TaxID=2200759 RepID=UPI0013001790|nr:low temperature requirement protein A [Glycomyces dulcitolivorans]
MSEQMTSERHATWLELFFDLVVVAAVSQLTHLLVHPSGVHVAAFFVLYTAIWLVWTSFTIYSNVASEATHTRTMLLGMVGLAAMAAAIPEATGAHSAVFAAAYLYTSGVASQGLNRTGRIVKGWSAAQRNAGLLPFIVAFWVDDPRWKLALWALGVAMTLCFAMVVDNNDPERMRQFQERMDERAERHGRPLPVFQAWDPHASHLGERLGLFIIIVLGEAVLQLIGAIGEVEWGWSQVGIGLAGFGLLIGLWWLNFRFGFDEENQTPPRILLPAHLVVAVSITLIAFGLGTAAEHATDPLPNLHRWLLCAALVLCLALCALANRAWWAFAILAAPLALAAFGSALSAVTVVLVLAAAVAGFVVYFNRRSTA